MLRRVLLVAAIVAAAVLAGPGSPAQARPCYQDHYCSLTYYSDSSYTTVVGVQYTGCDGESGGWGVRSSYLEFVEIPC